MNTNLAIEVKQLQKSFSTTEVFKNFSCTVEKGEITAIFGPNGSGKSTLLHILSGIISKDGGEVHMPSMNRYEFSYIFQNYRESLLPWRTNYENIAFPLELQKMDKNTIQDKIEELQKIFELDIEWSAYPYQLSGGQQQVLAFMRALVTNPKVLFIDEPFSALDYENTLRMREHLQKYFLKYRPTIFLITHDIEEAVHLASKVIVFSRKPTTVIETIDIPIAYPRSINTIKTATFNEIQDNILEVFQKSAQL